MSNGGFQPPFWGSLDIGVMPDKSIFSASTTFSVRPPQSKTQTEVVALASGNLLTKTRLSSFAEQSLKRPGIEVFLANSAPLREKNAFSTSRGQKWGRRAGYNFLLPIPVV